MSRPPQLIRYKGGKFTFEVLTNEGTAQKYRDGKLDFDKVPYIEEIYKNQAKGDRAKDEELKSVFGTDNISECFKVILEKGDLQLTTAERKEKVEKKRAEIVNYIHKYYTDPRSKTPHPVVRIENALQQLKVRIDPDLTAEKQCQEIVKKLPDVLPIKKSEMEGVLTVPHSVVGPVSGVVQQWCKIQRENYDNEGCTMEVSIVPGDYETFMTELQRASKGNYQFNIAGQENAPQQKEEKGKGKGGGRGGRGKGRK